MSNEIFDFSNLIAKRLGNKQKYKNPNELSFQHPCNALLAAATGQGKSNLLLSLLLLPELKMYHQMLYLVCPSIDEDIYQFLQLHYQDIVDEHNALMDKKFKNSKEKPPHIQLGDVFKHISKYEDLPPIESIDKTKQNIWVIDDFVTDKKINEWVSKFCLKNRKTNSSLIYLSQSLYDTPRIVRRQLKNGYLVLWGSPSGKELQVFQQDFNAGVEPEEFIQMYKTATSIPYMPMIIDYKTKSRRWRFRQGFKVPLGKEDVDYAKRQEELEKQIKHKLDGDSDDEEK